MTTRQQRQCKHAEQFARAHPIGWMLRRAVTEAGSVYGPATLWLHQLNSAAPADAKARDDWPKTPEQLARTFGELSEGLRVLGVVVARSRMMICGRVHRVWRVESVFNHTLNQKPRGLLLGGVSPSKPSIKPDSAKMDAIRSETRLDYSEHIGVPQMLTKPRKMTIEECRRVCVAEAPHIGAETVETQIGNTNARRLWAVCPKCERRVCFLYQRPDAPQWACRTCHNLTTCAQQQKGTKAAFEQWLTMDRWSRMVEKHPAMAELYKAIHDDWQEKVAPFDPDKISAERRAELLTFYANDTAIKRVFEDARWHWSGRMEEMNAQVGEQIRNDIWRYWKWLNRSRPR